MSLEDIFRALEEEAKERCAEIRLNAGAEIEQIDAESSKLCEELVHERMERAAAPLEARSRRIVNDARFERRRAVATERERMVDSVYETAAEGLKSLHDSPSYPSKFGALLDEALASAGTPTSVAVSPADEALVVSALKERGIDLPVRADLDSSGGVLVFSNGDRVRHDNTFEARLALIADVSRTHVGELLFG